MRPSLELNKAHLKTPMVGDYWTEHFVLQFVVLRILVGSDVNKETLKKGFFILYFNRN